MVVEDPIVKARSDSVMAMAALDGDVRKSLLDRTDAEKAFRPWWDTIEDMLLNTLIGLGKRHFTPRIMIFFLPYVLLWLDYWWASPVTSTF